MIFNQIYKDPDTDMTVHIVRLCVAYNISYQYYCIIIIDLV